MSDPLTRFGEIAVVSPPVWLRFVHALRAAFRRLRGVVPQRRNPDHQAQPHKNGPTLAREPTRVGSEVSVAPVAIAVPSTFGPADYAALFRALGAPGCKLLGLSEARSIRPDFFAALAAARTLSPEMVPRLGVVLRFDHWALLRDIGDAHLSSLRARGVDARLFYEEQARTDLIGGWFASGVCEHHPEGILQTLRRAQPAPLSPVVLEAAAAVIYDSLERGASVSLLIELARVAFASGATIKALSFAREALVRLGPAVTVERFRALRVLGLATMREGMAAAAAYILDGAVLLAVELDAIEEAADLLRQLGCCELDAGNDAAAETRFRNALQLLWPRCLRSNTDLRASLHHNLALALFRHDSRSAEMHAAIALGMRAEVNSLAAQADLKLLDRIRQPLVLSS